jgi:hypothetical protein
MADRRTPVIDVATLEGTGRDAGDATPDPAEEQPSDRDPAESEPSAPPVASRLRANVVSALRAAVARLRPLLSPGFWLPVLAGLALGAVLWVVLGLLGALLVETAVGVLPAWLTTAVARGLTALLDAGAASAGAVLHFTVPLLRPLVQPVLAVTALLVLGLVVLWLVRLVSAAGALPWDGWYRGAAADDPPVSTGESPSPTATDQAGPTTDPGGGDPLDIQRLSSWDAETAVQHLAGSAFGTPTGDATAEIVAAHVDDEDRRAALTAFPEQLAGARVRARLHPTLCAVTSGDTQPSALAEMLDAYALGLLADDEATWLLHPVLELLARGWAELDRDRVTGVGSATVKRFDAGGGATDTDELREALVGRRGEPLHPVARACPHGPVLVSAPTHLIDGVRELFATADRQVVSVPTVEPSVTVVELRLADDLPTEAVGGESVTGGSGDPGGDEPAAATPETAGCPTVAGTTAEPSDGGTAKSTAGTGTDQGPTEPDDATASADGEPGTATGPGELPLVGSLEVGLPEGGVEE